jgi:hypothetical protein
MSQMIDYNEFINTAGKERKDLTKDDIELLTAILKEEIICIYL